MEQRDILITFLDQRDKKRLLTEAHNRRCIKYKEYKIEVYPDLLPGTISKYRETKTITIQFQLSSVKYRWIGPAKIQVTYKGTTLFETGVDSEMQLLDCLGLTIPIVIKRHLKENLDLLSSLTKQENNKKPGKDEMISFYYSGLQNEHYLWNM